MSSWITAILLSCAIITVKNGHCCTINVTDSNSIDDILMHDLTNNSTLCFTNHSKWYEVTEFFIIENLTNVTIQGPIHITCSKGVGLIFYNVSKLRFLNVTIKQCGLRLANDKLESITSRFQTSPYHFQPNITVGVFLINSLNVLFQEVNITETQGIGLVCVNVLGKLEFSDVLFQYNQPADIEECKSCLFPYDASANCIFNPVSVSGSILLLYLNSVVHIDNNHTSVSITRAAFIDNFSCSMISLADVQPIYDLPDKFSRNIPTTSGIEVVLAQSDYSVDITINSSVFVNNTGLVGSGLNIGIFESALSCAVNIENCTFSYNGLLKYLLPDLLPSYGGAVTMIPYMPSVNRSSHVHHASHSLDMTNCLFHENSATIGGAIFIPNIQANKYDDSAKLLINIIWSTFTKNKGVLGHGIFISGADYFSQEFSVSIAHCNISNNELNDIYNGSTNPESYGVVYLTQITALLSDTVFINNTGTAINLALSSLLLEDDVCFKDNNAISGGALYLQVYSVLVFRNNSRVQFIRNVASTVGGAIFYDHKFNPASNSFTDCFIYFNKFDPFCTLINSCYSEEMNITVNFTDNGAGKGLNGYGSAIYGAGLYCPWLVKNGTDFSVIDMLSEDFSDVLVFSPNVTSEYVIATSSREIHADDISSIDIMPGQIMTVNLSATDHYGRPAVDTVAAGIISRQFKATRNSSANILTSGYQLLQGGSPTPTKIRINGTEHLNTSLVIYSVTAGAQLKIPIRTTNCWFGFVYDATHHTCLCDPRLLSRGVTCNYLDGYLRRPSRKWIGILENDIVVLPCVYDFCTDLELVDPNKLEDQCSDNRGGLLCGGCQDGYSAKTGHDGCGRCEGVQNLVWFILCILLIGAWLVFATAFLRIYVSDGYIYGMFFYVNIVFLFRNQIFNGKEYIYAIFNLRSVYDICIYKNMDTLTVAGLDFVYPLYLLLIMISLTLIARCRGPYRKTRFGYSTTKVFATLLYTCYSLLVDYSFQILSVVVIEAPSGKQFHWRLDPNIYYFRGLHGFLGTVSILCLLVLFAVALILLFPKQSYQFRIVQKLKPLIDAFQAPFKIKYSFWIGLRLLFRICFHIIAIAVPDKYKLYAVGCILCLLLYVQTVCMPYANSKINFLDNLFIILLLMQFIEALAKVEVLVIITACTYLFLLIYSIFVVIHVFHRYPKIYRLIITSRDKLLSLVSRSHRKGYTEINSFAEDTEPITEPFQTSIRTDYASVPTTTIPEIPEVTDYTRFRESILEVIDDGK